MSEILNMIVELKECDIDIENLNKTLISYCDYGILSEMTDPNPQLAQKIRFENKNIKILMCHDWGDSYFYINNVYIPVGYVKLRKTNKVGNFWHIECLCFNYTRKLKGV